MYVALKLRSDPIFPAAFELFRDTELPILDVGCGVGLLAAYLRERNCTQPIIGIDRDERKIAFAQELASGAGYADVEFREADVLSTALEFCGNAALFDVLHYLPSNEQEHLLATLAGSAPPGGVIAVRDAPSDGSGRFLLTYAGEKLAQTISWNVGAPLHFPSADRLQSAFEAEAFTTERRPLWGKTPFNNYLFVFRRRSSAAVLATG